MGSKFIKPCVGTFVGVFSQFLMTKSKGIQSHWRLPGCRLIYWSIKKGADGYVNQKSLTMIIIYYDESVQMHHKGETVPLMGIFIWIKRKIWSKVKWNKINACQFYNIFLNLDYFFQFRIEKWRYLVVFNFMYLVKSELYFKEPIKWMVRLSSSQMHDL